MPLETWLLPKSDMLSMIRCQEDSPEDAREEGQVAKSMDEENQRKKASSPPRPRTSGQGPGHPAPGATTPAEALPPTSTGPGHPARARKSGQKPGNPAPRTRTYRSFHRQPGHPAPPEAPDIRPDARTSGSACLCTVKGRSPCTSSPP